jgi:hypothetical protein|tara:strand:+ start:170 stop:385 length:216 start_codon:yes stop_codon:yes gene_type:complete
MEVARFHKRLSDANGGRIIASVVKQLSRQNEYSRRHVGMWMLPLFQYLKRERKVPTVRFIHGCVVSGYFHV